MIARTGFLAATGVLLVASSLCQAQLTVSNPRPVPAPGESFITTVPAPTGPSKVGTLSMRMVDPERSDPYRADGSKRELVVRFWYPASSVQGCKPAAYTSAKVWAYYSQMTGFPLPSVRTNSCLGAPIAEGAHPVVVFTHGYTGALTDSTFIFEDLASRGYVVASVAHTYETTAVEFPDGRLVTSVFGSYLAGSTLRVDDASLEFARSVRLADLTFVLDEIERLSTRSNSPFAGHLDMSRIALTGHSLGGEVSLFGLKDARFRAAVLIEGVLSDVSVIGTDKPVLLLAAGREHWSEQECRLWNSLHGPRLAVNLKGADHFTPSDAIWMLKDLPGLAVPTGAMGPKKTMAAVRNYIAAFFDANLRGQSQRSLLNRASSEYPDAVVTTQKQPLCSNPMTE